MQSVDYGTCELAKHVERPGTRQCSLTISMAWRRSSSTALLLLSLVCAGLLDSAVAKTHIVGGDKGWTQTNVTDTFYDEWAAQQKFEVDDELLFVYKATTHNVWVVPPIDVDTCNVANAVEKYEDANATVELYRSGDFAFVCEYLGHCQNGMKMKITVGSGATVPGSGPALAPGEAPEPGGDSPPAPPGGGEAPHGSTPPEAPETPEPPSDTTPPSPSAATSLQSPSQLLAGGLFVCLAAVLST